MFILLTYFMITSVFCTNNTGVNLKKTFIYNRYKYDESITVIVNRTTEQFLDFYEDSNNWEGYPTRVDVAVVENITSNHPLFITATQQKGIASWEIPLVVTTKSSKIQFNDVSRTLCPHDAGPNVTSVSRPSLQISTASQYNVTAFVQLRRVSDFFVSVDKDLNITVKPSTPKYYYFSFDSTPQNISMGKGWQVLPRFNYTIPKSVILTIESDDDICATISIQNNSCPVFDNEQDVIYQGYHLTMTTKGGITLTQSMFPQGFYIVFIVRENDQACTGHQIIVKESKAPGRVKTFRFRVEATISYKEYVIGALVTLALIFVIAILVAALPMCHINSTETVVIEDGPGPSNSAVQDTEDHSDDDSSTELEGSLTKPLTVAGLSRVPPAALFNRSNRYFWTSLTVAVVYALPVVQLLITYQEMVFSTGNQDLCYYNFLCAHPLGYLSDFGHVYSNIGYVVLGLVFMAQVSRGRAQDTPRHRGIFYSMALALAMEGVLSACYHLCPNKMNFQFDSSFMYVTAALVLIKLYQNRHPDAHAAAHTTFLVLTAVMTIGLFGIMYPSVYFWAFFTVLHLTTCLVLTLKIYYVGKFKIQIAVLNRVLVALRERGVRAFRPARTARALLLAAACAANVAAAVLGMYNHKKDFARHLLVIMMGNAFLYTVFYVVMKVVVHKEPMRLYTWLYLVGAAASWAVAFVYFFDSRTKWSETPAQSRQHNARCSVLQFYDSHDVWHIASASAMFLYFNMLLTIDDAVQATPKDRLPVF
ncbi:hypothetical protein ACJJTC_019131 [Scirpophaga incertulas]